MRTAFLLTLSALAAFSSAGTKVVLGKLGRTTSAAQIYAAPSSKARGIFRIAAQTRVVVRSSSSRWTAVVMNGGRLGYVPSQAVELMKQENGLTFDVTETQEPTPSFAPTASRGGVLRGSADARTQMAYGALRYEGSTPYKWGGNEIGSGIDCSGFVKKMYGEIGLNLPRTAAEQAMVGLPISRLEDLRSGDRLYFYEAKRNKIGHTGIFVGMDKGGRGWFVHSSSGHHGIARDVLSERWRRILVAARR